jgi:hypothetical protein
VFFTTALISLATTTPIAERTPCLENLDPVTFRISRNGQEYELRGTVEVVVPQMDVLHEGFSANLTARINEDRSDRTELEKRTWNLPPGCIPVPGQSWNAASAFMIIKSEVPWPGTVGDIKAEPGPGWCTRAVAQGVRPCIFVVM